MARTIHESIAGVELFVPDANDFFDILPTGLPNGDPALRILHQSGATDVRAFAVAPTISPNIFKAPSEGWSFSCWVRRNGNANQSMSLFAVQNSLATSTTVNGHQPLVIRWNGLSQNQLTLNYHRNTNNGGTRNGNNTLSTWSFFVFRFPAVGQPMSSYVNTDVDFTTHGNVSAMTFGYSADLRVCIGKYADTADTPSLFSNVDFGKLAFHDHILTLTECQMMYAAMTT